MASSHYLRAKLIELTFRSGAPLYVSLHSAEPTPDGLDGCEFAYKGYSRQLITFGEQSEPGVTANGNSVCFSAVQGKAIRVSGFAIWDSDGNMLQCGVLAKRKTFKPGAVPSWMPGQLTVRFG